MVRESPGERPAAPASAIAGDGAVAVISAYGAFRVLLVLLAVWTFFAGFSLLTQGVGALSFGGGDSATERVVGAHLLVLVPMYALLAWRRDEFRLLLWLPYAAQLAIIVPTFLDVIVTRDRDFGDAALLLIVSLIFLVLLVYFWLSSHPLDFFSAAEPVQEEDEDDESEEPNDDAYGSLGASPADRPPPS